MRVIAVLGTDIGMEWYYTLCGHVTRLLSNVGLLARSAFYVYWWCLQIVVGPVFQVVGLARRNVVWMWFDRILLC